MLTGALDAGRVMERSRGEEEAEEWKGGTKTLTQEWRSNRIGREISERKRREKMM